MIKATCLSVTGQLGALTDDVTVVGGLVPSLLIDQERLPQGESQHIGTRDLDLSVALGVEHPASYSGLADTLRTLGFVPAGADDEHPVGCRWKYVGESHVPLPCDLLVDVLVMPEEGWDSPAGATPPDPGLPGKLWPEMHVAFQDRRRVRLAGRTITGEEATSEFWVCGPGAFIVLKALAFDKRNINKDAYDLFFVLKHYGRGVGDVCARLAPLMRSKYSQRAVRVLEQDFMEEDAPGPVAVARFFGNDRDEGVRADVVGFTRQLLQLCGVWPQE